MSSRSILSNNQQTKYYPAWKICGQAEQPEELSAISIWAALS
jgi:hypothetical protein